MQPLAVLARLVEDVQTTYAGAVRVFDILDAQSDVTEGADAQELTQCEGRITFDHVSFCCEETEPVLQDISFEVQPGSNVRHCRAYRCGKDDDSSPLLERFYDPQSGRILLDGQDIRHLTLHSLRNQISMVLQDTFLFNGTYRGRTSPMVCQMPADDDIVGGRYIRQRPSSYP
ncbi:MAG: hypothetical protein ACLR23_15485 [Clostridia bacterium]